MNIEKKIALTETCPTLLSYLHNSHWTVPFNIQATTDPFPHGKTRRWVTLSSSLKPILECLFLPKKMKKEKRKKKPEWDYITYLDVFVDTPAWDKERWGGAPPRNRGAGMCHQMGWHFHGWIDYDGVAFPIYLLEWGRTFSRFLGLNVSVHFRMTCLKGFIRYTQNGMWLS